MTWLFVLWGWRWVQQKIYPGFGGWEASRMRSEAPTPAKFSSAALASPFSKNETLLPDPTGFSSAVLAFPFSEARHYCQLRPELHLLFWQSSLFKARHYCQLRRDFHLTLWRLPSLQQSIQQKFKFFSLEDLRYSFSFFLYWNEFLGSWPSPMLYFSWQLQQKH